MNGIIHDEKERCNQCHTLLEAFVATLGLGPGQYPGLCRDRLGTVDCLWAPWVLHVMCDRDVAGIRGGHRDNSRIPVSGGVNHRSSCESEVKQRIKVNQGSHSDAIAEELELALSR